MCFRWLRAVIAFVVAGGIALPVLYGIAMTISPNRTPDGHPTMPIGQVAFALFGAPIVGIIVGWLVGRVPRRPLD
jgi:hypothetical protein